MSYETMIDEQIRVWVFFDLTADLRPIFPIAMSWRRHLVKFQKVIFVSSRKIGENKILNIVCASDAANFELEYDSSNYSWKLKKIMPLS